jgi:hypothetical protein
MNFSKGDKLIYHICDEKIDRRDGRRWGQDKYVPCVFIEPVGKKSARVEMAYGAERIKTVLLKKLRKLENEQDNHSGIEPTKP